MNPAKKLRIAIAVHGRFHSLDLARGLTELGHDVTVFASYPRFKAKHHVPNQCRIVTNWLHLILSKLYHRSRLVRIALGQSEQRLLKMFGRWAERQLSKSEWDVIYSWSSVSLELLQSKHVRAKLKLLARGSTHIAFQDRILKQEGLRAGMNVERPETETINREIAEYGLADAVVVLSQFCRQSFLDEGIASGKVILMPAGVELRRFKATTEDLDSRRARATACKPLRVLMCGTFCLRKGTMDFAEIVENLDVQHFEIRFVGSVSEDSITIKQRLSNRVQFVDRVTQSDLPHEFSWGDVFLFLSLEEGLPQTLFQAAAAGMPIIATTNSAVDDVLSGGGVGWAVPTQNPQYVINLLQQIQADRPLLTQKLDEFGQTELRSWNEAALSLERQIVCRMNDAFAKPLRIEDTANQQ